MLESYPRHSTDTPVSLSTRELEVLEMTSRGLTNTEMSAQLQVSVHAIKFHLSSIYRKLGVSNRTEAAVTHLRRQAGREEGTAE